MPMTATPSQLTQATFTPQINLNNVPLHLRENEQQRPYSANVNLQQTNENLITPNFLDQRVQHSNDISGYGYENANIGQSELEKLQQQLSNEQI